MITFLVIIIIIPNQTGGKNDIRNYSINKRVFYGGYYYRYYGGTNETHKTNKKKETFLN